MDGCSTTTATVLIEMRAQTVVALAQAEKSSFIYDDDAERDSCEATSGSGCSEVGHDTMTRQIRCGGGVEWTGELFIDKVI